MRATVAVTRTTLVLIQATGLMAVLASRLEAVQEAPPRVIRVEAAAALDSPGDTTPGGSGLLQELIDGLNRPTRLELAPGHYYLAPRAWEDPSCGNCEDPSTPVAVSVGLRVHGRGLVLEGPSPDSVIIHTRSGYGILFDDCIDCELRGVTVTEGARDPDGNATDAAVVVRASSVLLERCIIRDNIGDSATVARTIVGIAGVAGREGSDISLRGCRLIRNSWDGVALYRGARAEISDNVVDGVDKAAGGRVGGGRGVGIGLTWDAHAVVRGNLVTRYWKGIGVFVDASAEVRQNIVEDVLTWGIAYWDADRGRPVAFIRENAVYITGACGASITRQDTTGTPGIFLGNALALTGQNARYDSGEPYCTQAALAEEAVPPAFVIRDNLYFENREPGGAPGGRDLSRNDFASGLRPLLTLLQDRPALVDSRFLADFGPLPNLDDRANAKLSRPAEP